MFVLSAVAGWGLLDAAQLPLAPALDRGETVTPAFEGWYPNPDGTVTLSFGYYNRNYQESIDIPVGPNNRVDPGGPDLGQPTHFLPRRAWGVFTVTLSKDAASKEVVWTLVHRGQTLSVPGHTKREWMIDAISGDANNNRPPVIRFSPTGPTGQGPRGVTAPAIRAQVATPVPLRVWATDDGIGSRIETTTARAGREGSGPSIYTGWVKHRGPGTVTFEEQRPHIEGREGQTATSATFSEPGEYILRVHVTDSSSEDGTDQCCWTNGFLSVTVEP